MEDEFRRRVDPSISHLDNLDENFSEPPLNINKIVLGSVATQSSIGKLVESVKSGISNFILDFIDDLTNHNNNSSDTNITSTRSQNNTGGGTFDFIQSPHFFNFLSENGENNCDKCRKIPSRISRCSGSLPNIRIRKSGDRSLNSITTVYPVAIRSKSLSANERGKNDLKSEISKSIEEENESSYEETDNESSNMVPKAINTSSSLDKLSNDKSTEAREKISKYTETVEVEDIYSNDKATDTSTDFSSTISLEKKGQKSKTVTPSSKKFSFVNTRSSNSSMAISEPLNLNNDENDEEGKIENNVERRRCNDSEGESNFFDKILETLTSTAPVLMGFLMESEVENECFVCKNDDNELIISESNKNNDES